MKRLTAIFVALFSLTLVAADPAPKAATKEDPLAVQKKDERFVPITEKVATIELKTNDTVIYRTVNIGIGEALVLEFPEGVVLAGNPVVGDSALLKIEVDVNPLTLKVWSLPFQGVAENEMWGINTNLQLRTNVGVTFIINFVVSSVEKASNRIIITYPEFTAKQKDMQDQFVVLKNALQEEHKKAMSEVDKIAERRKLEMLTREFGEFFMCNTYKNREEKELVFLQSDRICKVGPETILINFLIKNRYRNYFYLDSVKVYAVQGGSEVEVSSFYWVDKYGIKFDEILKGAVGFTIKDYTVSYIIEISEQSGKLRKIRLEVGF